MKRSLLSLLAAFILSVSIAQIKAPSAVPAGAVAAKPNIIYYAGGSCVFYDAAGTQLLSVSSSEAVWSATPAKTAWVVVTPTSGGYYEYPNYLTSNVPTFATKTAMRPFWNADTVYNELVLLTGAGSSAKLMYTPKQIISVKNYNYSVTMTQGTDYTISGRTITQVGTKASTTYSAVVGSNKLKNTDQKSWTNVTYIPDRSGWKATNIFVNRASSLPKTMAILNAKQPLKVEFYGMSITAGLNTSGFAGDSKNFAPTAPFLHSYADLFGEQIQNIFGSQVTVINGSCGGKTAAWTDQYVTSMVTPNNPDLVFLDQGMNDIWGTTNAAFKASMSSAIQKIKTACPNAEIVLIGNMLPDSLGVGSPGATGPSLMRGLSAQLKALEQTGVVYYDFTQMCDTIYKRKGGAASCVSNSLHPNDFLARCYAQGLVELFYTTKASTPTEIEVAPQVAITESFMTIQPNPIVDGNFILKLADDVIAENTIISIYDLSGKQVAAFKQSSNTKNYQSSDLNISTGVYIFKAQVDGKVSTQKVVVK